MSVQWTNEQQQVIDLRNADLLVSAAAGSGKTAVLVERILQKVMDPARPVNIDQMVIVTFTRAAAGEMRDRIQTAIEREAAKYPENEHLQRQRTRIHMANITTIDSFCKDIVQNHFQEIGLEPAFRIADEGELRLMKQDVLSGVLEEFYEEGTPEFHRFTEACSSGKSDERIEGMILQLYDFSMSYPYPEDCFALCEQTYGAETYEELMQMPFMQALFTYLWQMMDYVKDKLVRARRHLEGVPEAVNYEEFFEYYTDMIDTLKEHRDYERWYQQLRMMEEPYFPNGTTKKSCRDKELHKELKGVQTYTQKLFEELRSKYFVRSKEQLFEDMADCREVIAVLVSVTKRFWECFREEKRRNNMLDFSDLEHEALHILLDEHGQPTQTALEYAQYYDEILIDEYQDSNLLQEYLLTAVCGHAIGKHNLFMVGDAKQSIYRFRLSRPELFMDKFHRYSTVEGSSRRIDLHKNFRSRAQVLESVNFLFARLMKEQLGGIAYNEETALYPGMEFEEREGSDYTTQLLLFDKKESEIDAVEYEAKLIAHNIKKLVSQTDGLDVYDKKLGAYRKAQYRDIAILLRSGKTMPTPLVKVLAAEGIPAYMVSVEGYFDTLEISTMLNFLRVMDNPLQDIPLLAVLKSPIGGFSDEDLARLRIFEREGCIYHCLIAYEPDGEDEGLRVKVSKFLGQLRGLRRDMYYMPIHTFICHILDVTGYGDYIGVMPGGRQRQANMDMLIEKAGVFEETSYKGVFQFVRYIEQLQKYNVEQGEASVVNENDNTVRIMTIHKSKGLEFPIVYVAGLGRNFNRSESGNAVILHPELGLGMNHVRPETRQKHNMLQKSAIVLQEKLESIGEEMRVLYVAFTRAREKLILTGGVNHLGNVIKKAYDEGYARELSYGMLLQAQTYMDWILAALAGHRDMKKVLEEYVNESMDAGFVREPAFSGAGFDVQVVTLEDVMFEDLEQMAEEERMELDLDGALSDLSKKERDGIKSLPEPVIQALEFEYPHSVEGELPIKVSVSELKRMFEVQEEDSLLLETGTDRFDEAGDIALLRPSFMEENVSEEASVAPTSRGTAYHKVLECLDYAMADDVGQVEEQLERLYADGILEDRMRSVINKYKIHAFVTSSIGRRMKRAQENGKLKREQPFVFSLPAHEVWEQQGSAEPVMIQGIIDAYFEEDGALVLVDYKTDYIEKGLEKEWAKRYEPQINYYKRALESLTGKHVKESVLYSVFLEKEIVF